MCLSGGVDKTRLRKSQLNVILGLARVRLAGRTSSKLCLLRSRKATGCGRGDRPIRNVANWLVR